MQALNWNTIKLLFARELKDQLRDRRTLFTVVVLPLLIYPLLGISLIQITQFFREHPTKIWIAGHQNLPAGFPLVNENRIAERWLTEAERKLIDVQLSAAEDGDYQRLVEFIHSQPELKTNSDLLHQFIQREMAKRQVDLALFFPQPIEIKPTRPDDSHRIVTEVTKSSTADLPAVYVFQNSSSDKSVIAAQRADRLLRQWRGVIVEQALNEHGVSRSLLQLVRVSSADVSGKSEKQAAAWAKTIPLIIMIWCLTGAFYPAVDLCAGEKERGTFETLLSSPAKRAEIALGKLFTVMTFSASTALLNLISLGFTSMFVITRMAAASPNAALPIEGPPPLSCLIWIVLAIFPAAALFSAVSLAAAAFARSSKEGQYYLVPLIMISMPLMMLPMLPAAKLDLGTSLIPITGLMLLLRGLIESDLASVAQFIGPVMVVTLAASWLAIRWVVHQFNSETILFRASERFSIGLWLRQVIRERDDRPWLGHAALCVMIILVVKFFVGFSTGVPHSFAELAKQTVVVLIATVAMPAVLMAMILTRRPGLSLRLTRCRWSWLALGPFLAICLHPLFMLLSRGVMHLYPPSASLVESQTWMTNILSDAPSLWLIVLVLALAPAVIEELAFRGFILSGMQRLRNEWWGILATSLAFGAAHAIFQQSIITFVVGIILGVLAVRTGSLWPCILYHFTHNALSVCMGMPHRWDLSAVHPLIFRWQASGQVDYHPGAVVLLGLTGILLLVWLIRLDRQSTPTFGRVRWSSLNWWQSRNAVVPANEPITE